MSDVVTSASLPFMGRVDSGVSLSGVGESYPRVTVLGGPRFPTPVAARLDPPHKGEGGRGDRLGAIDQVQLAISAGGMDAARAFYAGGLGVVETPKPPELVKRGARRFEGAEL